MLWIQTLDIQRSGGRGRKQELAALGLGLLLATDALSLVAAGGLALGSLGLMGEGKVWGYKFFN